MTHLDDTTRNRITKLLALAKRGVGGEQSTAQKALAAMLARHGLTMADVDSDLVVKRRVRLRTANAEEALVAVQVAAHFAEVATYWQPKRGAKTYVEVEVTPAEGAKIAVAWEVYRKAYRAERAATLDALRLAFTHKHALWNKVSDDHDDTPEPLSPEEVRKARERRQRALAMAGHMADVAKPVDRLPSATGAA